MFVYFVLFMSLFALFGGIGAAHLNIDPPRLHTQTRADTFAQALLQQHAQAELQVKSLVDPVAGRETAALTDPDLYPEADPSNSAYAGWNRSGTGRQRYDIRGQDLRGAAIERGYGQGAYGPVGATRPVRIGGDLPPEDFHSFVYWSTGPNDAYFAGTCGGWVVTLWQYSQVGDGMSAGWLTDDAGPDANTPTAAGDAPFPVPPDQVAHRVARAARANVTVGRVIAMDNGVRIEPLHAGGPATPEISLPTTIADTEPALDPDVPFPEFGDELGDAIEAHAPDATVAGTHSLVILSQYGATDFYRVGPRDPASEGLAGLSCGARPHGHPEPRP